MNHGLEYSTFGKIARVFNGNSISAKEKAAHFSGLTEGMPYLGTKDIGFDGQIKYDSGVRVPSSRQQGFKLAPAGTVLICAEGGSAGKKIAYTERDVCFGNKLFAVCPAPPNVGRFVYYYCMSDYFTEQFKDGLAGLIGGVSLKKFKDFKIALPTPSEQQRIVAILDEAFEGISAAKANAERNLENTRVIFENHLESVFSRQDEGWVRRSIADACAITSVLVDPRQDEYRDFIHVGAGNIESNTGVLGDLKTARDEGLISGKFVFDDSMVLYSKIRPYLVKVVRPCFQGLCSADIYPLTPNPNFATRDFLFYLLLSKSFTNYAVQGSARAGMPKVNRKHLFAYATPFPPVEEQLALTEQLDGLREETQHLETVYQRKVAALDTLKQSLLHHAFSGQL